MDVRQNTLAELLDGWDGKDTRELEAVFEEYRKDPAFLADLVHLTDTPTRQQGTTWLLKHHFDTRKTALPADLVAEHISQFPMVQDWQARLHILQYLEHLDLPEDAKATVCTFVDQSLGSDRTFVRAWAWHGLVVLAERYPERRAAALDRLKEAQAAETAGSVKVRIRKALDRLNG